MPKNKRSRTKNPALTKKLNLKSRQEQASDFDYVDGYTDPETGESIRPLTEKEKKFLNNFIEEEINADFRHKGKKLNKRKKDKRRIYKNNNARNRCMLTRAKARGRVLGIDDLPISYTQEKKIEDQLIEAIDIKSMLLRKK